MTSTLKVYRHGMTAGVRPQTQVRGIRGECQGWSLESSRSNTRFLYSVRETDLIGFGVACSLTVRDCPPTHEDWASTRRAWLKRLERMGAIRVHWLTEWQARGVPHMHAIVYFPDPGVDLDRQRLTLMTLSHWLAVSAPWGSSQHAQHVTPVTDVVGWLKYLSKHAARGAWHYQRMAQGIPQGWTKTGRMWGHTGDWPTDEPLALDLDWSGWFKFRRLCRSYRIAQARALAHRSPGALRAARHALRCPVQKVAPFRGVSGWVPQAVTLRMVEHLAALGCEVVS
jgi:hypothetical protein